jgi:hypothetical protein
MAVTEIGIEMGKISVVVTVPAGIRLNPHPLKSKGAAPKCRNVGELIY